MEVADTSIEKRKYERRPYNEPIRYYLTVLQKGELEKIYKDGISVDISDGGLGMITDLPLTRGDVVYFEPEISINYFAVKASVVVWAKEIGNNKYRIGLEFHIVYPTTGDQTIE